VAVSATTSASTNDKDISFSSSSSSTSIFSSFQSISVPTHIEEDSIAARIKTSNAREKVLSKIAKELADDTCGLLSRVSNSISFQDAMSRPNASDWHIAMINKYNALVKNNIFSLEPRPENRIIVPCDWVFKTKYRLDGKVDKLKARAVAKEYQQVYSVDFFETYTPVTRMTSIHVIIAIAAHSNLELQQIDVDSAFLNGLIDAEIYMSQPPGFEDKEHPNYVYKLLKSLYGLK
jgi:hypothetical protein